MRKFLTALILIPLALILVDFAVANHHLVTVSFDPFDQADPELGVTMPLFAILIVAAILGVVVGGCATWFGQRRWRRAARQHEADARSARAELASLRASTAAPRQDPQRLPVASAAGLYGPVGRDKQRATL
jgi:uncharacterized integral membrane protein